MQKKIFFHPLKSAGRIILPVIALITIASIFPLHRLRFEFNVEKYFPSSDSDLVFFRDFSEKFQSAIDDNYIFIGITSPNGIFDRLFLQKADSLTKYIESLPAIAKVYSATNLRCYYSREGKLFEDPLIHVSRPGLYASDSLRLHQSVEYKKLILSKDERSLAISAFHQENLSQSQKDELISGIQTAIERTGLKETSFTAKIRMEKIYAEETVKNLIVYLIATFSVIALSLFLLFRSLKDVLIPFACILISVIWTLSFASLIEYPIDILMSLLPPVLAVICMSDIIHISTRYRDELRLGFSKNEALQRTFKDIGRATFFTSLTTAVGFYSLCITNIQPVKNFGFVTGTGVLLAFFITIGFLWAVYQITPAPFVIDRMKRDEWQKILHRMLLFLIRYRIKILCAALMVTITCAYFISKIEINSTLLQEIPKQNPVLKEFRFMEEQFAGTRAFELNLTLTGKNASFYDIAMLREMDEFCGFIEDSLGVGFLISPVSFFKNANKAFMGGGKSYFTLPGSQREINYCYDKLMMSFWGKEMERYITTDGSTARISGRLPDISAVEFQNLTRRLENYLIKRTGRFHFQTRMTGSSLLYDKVSHSLIVNMFQGIAIGFLLISLIGFFLFRSYKMIFIVIIPNVLPLAATAAFMGLLGIWLKADTSIIFSIALGIAVDDTIHFISKVKIESDKGKNVLYAVKRAYLTTGKAMIITTLVLFAGFMTLLFSSFGGTFYIGVLVSLCLLSALIADMTLTPLLLMMWYGKKRVRQAVPEEQVGQVLIQNASTAV